MVDPLDEVRALALRREMSPPALILQIQTTHALRVKRQAVIVAIDIVGVYLHGQAAIDPPRKLQLLQAPILDAALVESVAVETRDEGAITLEIVDGLPEIEEELAPERREIFDPYFGAGESSAVEIGVRKSAFVGGGQEAVDEEVEVAVGELEEAFYFVVGVFRDSLDEGGAGGHFWGLCSEVRIWLRGL